MCFSAHPQHFAAKLLQALARVVRRAFRRSVLDLLRETTATDEEFRREARSLLGHAPE